MSDPMPDMGITQGDYASMARKLIYASNKCLGVELTAKEALCAYLQVNHAHPIADVASWDDVPVEVRRAE